MLAAEGAILVHLNAIRCVFLVLKSIVVSLLALATSQYNFNSHFGTSL